MKSDMSNRFSMRQLKQPLLFFLSVFALLCPIPNSRHSISTRNSKLTSIIVEVHLLDLAIYIDTFKLFPRTRIPDYDISIRCVCCYKLSVLIQSKITCQFICLYPLV